MEEKVVRDFTTIPRKMRQANRYLKFLAVFGAVLCMSWSSEQTDAPIALAIFQDIVLPLNLPENIKLNQRGMQLSSTLMAFGVLLFTVRKKAFTSPMSAIVHITQMMRARL